MSGAIAIGLAGGVIAGLLGVGGGVLFVPGLVLFLSLDQHHAEATSLLAIVPVALVGTVRQDRYGNVHRRDALLLGLLSVAGAAGGVALANTLSGVVLRDAFAALMVAVAIQLVQKTLREGRGRAAGTPSGAALSGPGPVAPPSRRRDGPDHLD
ncbi:MAG: TSUP family transporter [Solirubrobacteraceae bacterium]